jgi:hypothetical protein
LIKMKRIFLSIFIISLILLAGCASQDKIMRAKDKCVETCFAAMENKIAQYENPAEYPKTIQEIESRKAIDRDFCIKHASNPDPKEALKGLKRWIETCQLHLEHPEAIPHPSYDEPNEKPLETRTIPCEFSSDEESFLFKERDTLETIEYPKFKCGIEFEVLQRVCVRDWPHMFTLTEMDLIRQGDLEGWIMRDEITCSETTCKVAPRTICDQYPEVYNSEE